MAPKILYIEDNADNRALVRRVLLAEGFEYDEAETAEIGLRKALDNTPDLILMDINMPEVSGLTATQYIRQTPELETIPVVALTANAMQQDLDDTIKAGCDGYIVKPIDIDRFPKQILHYLRSRR